MLLNYQIINIFSHNILSNIHNLHINDNTNIINNNRTNIINNNHTNIINNNHINNNNLKHSPTNCPHPWEICGLTSTVAWKESGPDQDASSGTRKTAIMV